MTDQSQLSDTDAELLAELKRVGSDIVFRQKTRRIMRIIMAVALFAFIFSVVSVVAYIEVRSVQLEVCRRSNDFRKAYVDQWSPILADSPKPKKPPAGSPKEVVEAYERQVKTRERFKESLDTDFAPQPC